MWKPEDLLGSIWGTLVSHSHGREKAEGLIIRATLLPGKLDSQPWQVTRQSQALIKTSGTLRLWTETSDWWTWKPWDPQVLWAILRRWFMPPWQRLLFPLAWRWWEVSALENNMPQAPLLGNSPTSPLTTGAVTGAVTAWTSQRWNAQPMKGGKALFQ